MILKRSELQVSSSSSCSEFPGSPVAVLSLHSMRLARSQFRFEGIDCDRRLLCNHRTMFLALNPLVCFLILAILVHGVSSWRVGSIANGMVPHRKSLVWKSTSIEKAHKQRLKLNAVDTIISPFDKAHEGSQAEMTGADVRILAKLRRRCHTVTSGANRRFRRFKTFHRTKKLLSSLCYLL